MTIRSRREFLRDSLRSASALGALGVLSKFGQMNALAQSGQSGYQALVCIYLSGGNDGHNLVIPISTAQQGYAQYQKARPPLAIAQGNLHTIMNGSDSYGLHTALPEIQALYNQGKAAVLANVGNLVQPITRAQYQSNNLTLVPNALFSHADQSNQWQSAIPNGIATSGWGGRIADFMQTQNSSAIFPPISSIAGCGLFCSGQQTFPATVPPPYSGQTAGTSMAVLNGIQNAPSTAAGMQQLLTFSNGLQLVQAGNGALSRGNDYANTLTGLLQTPTITTVFPAGNPLAAQLQTVANVMSVRNELGLTRQIFFCTLGSFDTHGTQRETQLTLLGYLSKAVSAFYAATQELGIDQNVTTFTASEFGRTLMPSGNDGTDHAWGSHHFVVGGGVQGGKFYGTFPLLQFGGPDDANSRGTLLPSTGIAQYGATMAEWFGVPAANLPSVFPTIGNFTTPNLGFMG